MDGAKQIVETNDDLYHRDFAEWCALQSSVLERPELGTPDWDNIREEIEGLAARDRKELQNRIIQVIEHRLKMDHSRATAPMRGWQETVWTQQVKIEVLLEQSPSLRQLVPGMIDWGYPRAKTNALKSFEFYEPESYAQIIDEIPESFPFTVTDIVGEP